MREKNIQFQIPFRKFVVLKLMEPFTGYEKNVTTDNFFTSVSLATKLLAKNIIIVGIIRGNKRELLAKEQKEKMTLFSIFKKIIFFLQCVKMN